MKCAHCQASNAKFLWNLQACADKRNRRRKYLCTKCDIEFNRRILVFFNYPEIAAKMEAYKEKIKHDPRNPGKV